MAFSISNAMSGVGSAVSEVAGEYAKTAIAKNAKLDLLKVEAQIAAERDARLNDYAVDMETKVKQPFTSSERKAGQDFTAGQNEQQRHHTEALQQRLAVETLMHGDRMVVENKRLDNDGKRLGMEGARLANDNARLGMEREVRSLTVAAAKLDLDGKKQLAALKEEYTKPETTPERKQAIADSLYTLLQKDKYTSVVGKDDQGNPQFLGGFDTRTGELKTGRGAPAGGVAKPQTMADMQALPAGSQYIDPGDGKVYVKRGGATDDKKAPKAKGAEPSASSSSGIPLVSEPVDRMAAGRGSAQTISPDSMRQRGIIARQMADDERRREYGDAGY